MESSNALQGSDAIYSITAKISFLIPVNDDDEFSVAQVSAAVIMANLKNPWLDNGRAVCLRNITTQQPVGRGRIGEIAVFVDYSSDCLLTKSQQADYSAHAASLAETARQLIGCANEARVMAQSTRFRENILPFLEPAYALA